MPQPSCSAHNHLRTTPDAETPHPKAQQFVDSWFNARQLVNLGHRAAKPTPPPPPPPAPNP